MAGGAPVTPHAVVVRDDLVDLGVHLVDALPARGPDGAFQAVIEIPAGTTAKFEVDKTTGALRWELRDGAPRVIDYLPYPANYGYIPSTCAPLAEGGDGDALDVFVLGPASPRGEVLAVRVIGALRLLDEGEVDDKLLAVPLTPTHPPSAQTTLTDLADLDARYPGVRQILELWLLNYDGPGVISLRGWIDADEARALVEAGVLACPR